MLRRHGNVHHGMRVLFYPAKLGRSGNAHDANFAAAAIGKCLAERVTGEEFAGELLIDDDAAFAAFTFRVGEVSTRK